MTVADLQLLALSFFDFNLDLNLEWNVEFPVKVLLDEKYDAFSGVAAVSVKALLSRPTR
jgi:hypothetical protein